MTILHVVSSGGLYGIENMVLNLLPELEAQGEDVSLLCLEGEDSELPAAARGRGIRVNTVDCERPIAPRGWLSLFRFLQMARPDLVHLHGYKATILAGPMSLLLRRCPVVTYHGLASKLVALAPGLRKYVALETPILRKVAAVVAVSEEIRNEVVERGVREGKTRFIPNGTHRPTASACMQGRTGEARGPKLIAVGRLMHEKAYDDLIDWMAELRQEFPEISLHIAGDGSLRNELVAQAKQKGVEGHVHFLGFVSDVRPLLEGADCFVMPSRTEGMPMALIEAMAQGKPIVASRVGAIPSVVEEGTEALLVSPGDRSAFIEAVSSVLRSEALRKRLGAAARRRFEAQFTSTKMAEAYRELYREVCS